MAIILIIICFALVPILIISFTNSLGNNMNIERETTSWKRNLREIYGYETLEIKTTSNSYIDKESIILVYDKHETIIMNSRAYKYSDIIDFNINNQMSYKTSTSTGSMVGRGIVGGLLFGGVGALAGATTGNKMTNSEITEYKINVIMRDMSNPVINCIFDNEHDAQKMIAVLKNIIDYNEKIEK